MFDTWKIKTLTPLNPTASDWIVAVFDDVPPVIVSPALKSPLTLDKITTPWVAVADENDVTLIGVVPSELYNSKVVASGFLTV